MKTKKILARIVSLSLVFVLLFTCFAELDVSAASYKYAKTNTKIYSNTTLAYLQVGGSSTSETISKDTKLTVTGTTKWLGVSMSKISYGGKSYYIRSSNLIDKKSTTKTTAVAVTSSTRYVKRPVTCYSFSSSNKKTTYGQLPVGSKITLYSTSKTVSSVKYRKIVCDGSTYYIKDAESGSTYLGSSLPSTQAMYVQPASTKCWYYSYSVTTNKLKPVSTLSVGQKISTFKSYCTKSFNGQTYLVFIMNGKPYYVLSSRVKTYKPPTVSSSTTTTTTTSKPKTTTTTKPKTSTSVTSSKTYTRYVYTTSAILFSYNTKTKSMVSHGSLPQGTELICYTNKDEKIGTTNFVHVSYKGSECDSDKRLYYVIDTMLDEDEPTYKMYVQKDSKYYTLQSVSAGTLAQNTYVTCYRDGNPDFRKGYVTISVNGKKYIIDKDVLGNEPAEEIIKAPSVSENKEYTMYAESRLECHTITNGVAKRAFASGSTAYAIPAGNKVTCYGTVTAKSEDGQTINYTQVYHSDTKKKYYVFTSGLKEYKITEISPKKNAAYGVFTSGNVYKQPYTDSAKLNTGTVSSGAFIHITGTLTVGGKEWYRITYNGVTGYVLSSSVTQFSSGISFALDADSNDKNNLEDFISSYGRGANAYATFKKSWKVVITDSSMSTFLKNNGFSETVSSGSTGLCISDYKLIVVTTDGYKGSFWHEVGHTIYYRAGLSGNTTWQNIYKYNTDEAYSSAEVISTVKSAYNTGSAFGHITSSANEFFAESFELYVLGGNNKNIKLPKTSNLIMSESDIALPDIEDFIAKYA